MKIMLRTSGGRGEYELAGTQGQWKTSDLYDKEICLEILPNVKIKSNNLVKHKNGKSRIRLKHETNASHLYKIISALLLLHKPKRQRSTISSINNSNFLKENYSLTSILFDILKVEDNEFVVRPTYLIIGDSEKDIARIDFSERMKSILLIWDLSENGTIIDLSMRGLINLHKESLLKGCVQKMMDVSEEITKKEFLREYDPLRKIFQINNVMNYDTCMGIHDDTEDYLDENNTKSVSQINQEYIEKWRKQADRGKEGDKFRKRIKEIYGNTCLFSGHHLPKTNYTMSSGVDAAHILPWSHYKNNDESNGICLDKMCHWAFDNGILELKYNKNNGYFVSIPEIYLEKRTAIDGNIFKCYCGPIDDKRLPTEKKHWPKIEHLELIAEFNARIRNE